MASHKLGRTFAIAVLPLPRKNGGEEIDRSGSLRDERRGGTSVGSQAAALFTDARTLALPQPGADLDRHGADRSPDHRHLLLVSQIHRLPFGICRACSISGDAER